MVMFLVLTQQQQQDLNGPLLMLVTLQKLLLELAYQVVVPQVQ
jgi:hypothetical protein